MLTLSKISNIRSQLSPSELKIADYILACPEQVTHFSSQELAQQADVSQSSIVKFTQKIGFKAIGYGGATALDFTLPVIQKSGGIQVVPVAIVSGFILSLLGPILILGFLAI